MGFQHVAALARHPVQRCFRKAGNGLCEGAKSGLEQWLGATFAALKPEECSRT